MEKRIRSVALALALALGMAFAQQDAQPPAQPDPQQEQPAPEAPAQPGGDAQQPEGQQDPQQPGGQQDPQAPEQQDDGQPDAQQDGMQQDGAQQDGMQPAQPADQPAAPAEDPAQQDGQQPAQPDAQPDGAQPDMPAAPPAQPEGAPPAEGQPGEVAGGAMGETPEFDFDPAFVAAAAQGDLYEITSSGLVLEGENEEIRAFAQRMMQDHQATTQELNGIAQELGIELPTAPAPSYQVKLAHLLGLQGAELEQAYIEQQVMAHESAVALYRVATTDAQNDQLRAFAEEHLPALEEHLRMAQELAGQTEQAP